MEKYSIAKLLPAPKDRVFPTGFYVTTNWDSEIYVNSQWLEVRNTAMDCGIRFDAERRIASCVKMHQVKKGELYVVGEQGVRVNAIYENNSSNDFAFMTGKVSSERPKSLLLQEIAQDMINYKKSGNGKVLLVGGPAIVHTGAGEYLSSLIQKGYIQVLFTGNALAAHDIESSLFGTSLGVDLKSGDLANNGHQNHLYAINRIRELGSIKEAVKQGVLTSGIMYSCIQSGCDFILAGSIRDDGPLPEVIPDALLAQKEMRMKLREVNLVVMLASMLHSIAVGNLLPAKIKTVCVDINAAVVTKLVDRGSHQTKGVVTDVSAFLYELNEILKKP